MSTRILTCVFVVFSVVTGVFADDRLLIELFPYASINNADPKSVAKLLRERLQHLAEQTVSANPQLKRLNEVKIIEKDEKYSPLPASAEDLAVYWSNAHRTLEILFGDIAPAYLTSHVYLGDLNGSLKVRTLVAQISLTNDELRKWRDMHGALMLYALAMDAKNRNEDRGIIFQYLGETESLLKDVAERTVAGSDEDVRALSEAVTKEIQLQRK
jgi:hypothetical protein